MHAKPLRWLPILVVFLVTLQFGCTTNGDDASELGAAIFGVDPRGDWDCPDDPSGTGSDVLDVRGLEVQPDGDGVVVTITFQGDIEALNAATDEKLPIGVQFWLGEEYVEALFSAKNEMKVVDGKAGVSYELDGNKIRIRLSGLALERVTTVIANSIVSGYPAWDGLCYDDLEIDATDPDSREPKDVVLNNGDPNNGVPNNGVPNNGVPASGPRYIMLTDKSPTTSGDKPGSDIDRVEVCKSANSDCTIADVVAVESSEVVNAAGVTTAGGSEACSSGTYASLGGGYVILTFTDPTIDIAEGDNLRAFSVSEILCEAAGPNTEQSYDVAVGTSEVLDTFTSIGECGASIPCRLPVPQGI